MPRLSKIGAAALAAFGWTGGASVSASYLVVAGGGGGGSSNGSWNTGGGGAGGLLSGTVSLNPTLSYTVTVGAGGAAETNGSNSVLSTVTSTGGGRSFKGTPSGSGGSGGGSSNSAGTETFGTGTVGQGNNGGTAASQAAGGGGGAGAVGGNGGLTAAGNGGAGTASSISGSSVTYAGGGGGGAISTKTAGTGGSGGGGAGALGNNVTATAGTANTGGGGGGNGQLAGVGTGGTGGAGGSGIVIISYVGAQQFSGGVVTSSGGNTIHTFTTSGTLGPVTPLSANYLIVGGGAGGGNSLAGGGGAGGLFTGSGLTIDPYSTYLVTVGAGGAGGAGVSPNNNGGSGGSSSFSMVTSIALGGGGGGGYAYPTGQNGISGASGGGGAGADSAGGTGGAGTSGQGFAGGNGRGGSPYGGGGGGGNSGAGASAAGSNAGNGGIATANSISGTSTYYAGGGGGGVGYVSGTGIAGLGGGTATTAQKGGASDGASDNVTGTAANATANTGGGGGGGGGSGSTNNGGAGGSGVVIISYAGATQLMAGGVVTIAGGNVIHTFNSSGYLTPLTLLTRSLRFRKSASASLTKTFSSAPTSRTTMTMSAWVKRGLQSDGSTYQAIFGTGSNYENVSFNTDDTIRFTGPYSSGQQGIYITTQKFRDYAAWYHIVVVYDTTNATAGNRMRLFVNGVQVTSFSTQTNSNQNNTTTEFLVNGFVSAIGSTGGASLFDGYLAEVNVIDGQALAPTAFGTVNSYGVWQPITYGGSYGTNGFYLPFTNNASTTTLGYDFSPQGNNWTTNNISVTAGSTYDSMTDVPTLTSATAANFATLNPLIPPKTGGTTTRSITNGNLYGAATGGSGWSAVGATITAVSGSGKWYWEVSYITANDMVVGIHRPFTSTATFPDAIIGYTDGADVNGYSYYATNGNKFNNGSTAYGSSYTAGDTIGVALDMSVAGSASITFYKNNTSQGVAFSGLTGDFFPCFSTTHAAVASINFGQQPFVYTPPTGFVALNTFNL